MLLAFDIDCGPLVKGHRFIARGIGDQGTLEWDDRMTSPAFSLEYEVVPGITADETRGAPFSYLVRIDYEADVPLPWAVYDGGALLRVRPITSEWPGSPVSEPAFGDGVCLRGGPR